MKKVDIFKQGAIHITDAIRAIRVTKAKRDMNIPLSNISFSSTGRQSIK